MGQPRLGLQMLYFYQVGVAHKSLVSMRQSIPKLGKLVRIGSRANQIACPRATDRLRKVGFGFKKGHRVFSHGERRCFRPLMSLQCVTSRNPQERRVRRHRAFSESVAVAANFIANFFRQRILSGLQVRVHEVIICVQFLGGRTVPPGRGGRGRPVARRLVRGHERGTGSRPS